MVSPEKLEVMVIPVMNGMAEIAAKVEGDTDSICVIASGEHTEMYRTAGYMRLLLQYMQQDFDEPVHPNDADLLQDAKESNMELYCTGDHEHAPEFLTERVYEDGGDGFSLYIVRVDKYGQRTGTESKLYGIALDDDVPDESDEYTCAECGSHANWRQAHSINGVEFYSYPNEGE